MRVRRGRAGFLGRDRYLRDGPPPGPDALEPRLTPRRLQDLVDGFDPGGRWRLGPGHEISYRSAATRRGEKIRLKLTPVSAQAGALIVSLTQQEGAGRTVSRLARLEGAWALDPRNRLSFEIARSTGRSRKLDFGSSWTLDERHRVTLSLERASLKTRVKTSRRLVLDGHWELGRDDRLVYRVERGAGSLLVRGAFQTGSLLAREGVLRYQAGFEVSRTRRTRTLEFFGRWVASRDHALSFEIRGNRRGRTLVFGGRKHLGRTGEAIIELTGSRGRRLGLEIIVTRDILPNGTWFARWARSPEESRVETGMRVKW